MKICVMTSPFCELPPDAIGAVERRWFNVCTEFIKLGHEIQIIGKSGRTVLPSTGHLTITYVHGYSRTRCIYGDILLDFVFTLRGLRRMKNCDVLVCNTFWGPLLAPIFSFGRYRVLVYNVARFPKKHLALYTKVDLFACTSSSVKKALLKIPGTPKSKVVVINNPIDVSIFNADDERLHIDDITVGYHGRIHPEKGLDLLCKAITIVAQKHKGIRIKMIGSWSIGKGGGGDSYKRRLDELSGGRIDWMGAVANRQELSKLLRECTLYCYPSVADKGETFGVAPLEAMGLGLPVVVSGLECFRDFLDDGENGLVFDHRTSDAVERLARCIELLLSDTSLRKKIGKAAGNCARGFSTEKIALKYVETFAKALQEQK